MLHKWSSPRNSLLFVLALGGFILALFGTYWDDAWHTAKGRDSFLIPPHVCLYLGISVVGAVITLLAIGRVREHGLRSLFEPAMLLSSAGVVITLAAAPIDNGWHLAFGRDAVLWSPPHMLGVAGSLALSVGLLMLLGEHRHIAMKLLAAAAVVAVGLIPVLEYETDVPQFALLWFLPLLAFGSAFGLGLSRSLLDMRWAATSAAVVYSLLRLVIAAVLLSAELPVPLIPVLVLPALALDLVSARSRSRLLAAALFSVTLFAAYVPYLNLVKSDVFLGIADIVVGLPIAIALSYIALALADQPRASKPLRAAWGAAAPAALALAFVLSSTALAHDPGQGEEEASAKLTSRSWSDGAALTIDLSANSNCGEFEPRALQARRAGEVVEAELRRIGVCRYRGQAPLPDRGRWFLYGEFEQGGELLETWLPAHVGEDEVASATRALYQPPAASDSLLKIIAGVVVYAFLVAVLVLIALAIRGRTFSGLPPAVTS